MVNQYQVQNSRFKEIDVDTSQLGTTTTIENLNETVNQLDQEQKPANNIIVLAKRDNVTHNYFHYFELYWDARDCLSSIIIRMPKTDADNTKYWINYTGDIVLYMGDKTPDEQITNNENNKMTVTNYWDLQGMNPIFQGEVTRIKESKNELEIHVDSIGRRFKQKIPEEFRASYINGQNVRDAFQAICEFLGVKYICPPSQEQEEITTDGTENNVDTMQQAAKNITQQASQIVQQDQQSDTETSDNTNGQESNTITDNAEIPSVFNGYTDISFDVNGAIVHGSTAMEVGIDITDTLLNLEEHPLDKYLPDEEYEEGQSYLNDEKYFVMQDVRRLLNGEFFDTVHDNVMNYGAITITPASNTTSDMSSVGDVNGDGVVDEQDQQSADSGGSGCGSGSLNGSQLWTELSKVMHTYYPKASQNYWIGQLRDAPNNWTGVAKVVNQLGGDKSLQNNVISKVLCYKKRYKEMKAQTSSSSHSSSSQYQAGINRSHQSMYNIGKNLYQNRNNILNYMKGGH